jgi:drug/metabolite transporter (DMT)-like permease
MDDTLIIGILVGCLASITMNLGKGIQKMKVQVLKTGKAMLKPPLRRDFIIWLIGMLMTGAAGLLFTAALKMTDKPSVVSSLNGIGLIALAVFSAAVLKEKVGAREAGAVALIIIGTGFFQYFNVASDKSASFNLSSLLLSLAVCVAIYAALVVMARRLKKGQAFVYAAIAGTFLAYMVIFFDISGVKNAGRPFIYTIISLYFLIGFFLGNGAFVFTNIAFFHGSGIVIVPTVNSFMIVMPMVLEFVIYRVSISPIQLLCVLLIVAGVIILTTSNGHEVKETVQPAVA